MGKHHPEKSRRKAAARISSLSLSVALLSLCTAQGAAAADPDSLDTRLDRKIVIHRLTPRNFAVAAGAPAWVLTLSADVNANYESNALNTPTDPIGVLSTDPTLGLSLKYDNGSSVFALSGSADFARADNHSSDYDYNAFTLGSSWTVTADAAKLGGFEPTFSYRYVGVYDSSFDQLQLGFHRLSEDFSGELYTTDSDTVTLTISPDYRIASVAEANREDLDTSLEYDRKFADDWSLTVIGDFMATWYRSGANNGRDDIVLTFSAELDKKISDNWSVGVAAQYFNSSSNRAAAKFDGWIVGPKLSYSFDKSLAAK